MIKIGDSITLEDFEQILCQKLAEKRYSANRGSNVTNHKIGPQSDQETDLAGIAAEMALAKALNCYPDLSVGTRSSSAQTDKGDLVLPNGMTVDVKATKYRKGRLAIAPWRHPDGDLFVLMVGEFPTYTFMGCITQVEATKSARLGTLGHGKTFLVEQDELLPLTHFLKEAYDGSW